MGERNQPHVQVVSGYVMTINDPGQGRQLSIDECHMDHVVFPVYM